MIKNLICKFIKLLFVLIFIISIIFTGFCFSIHNKVVNKYEIKNKVDIVQSNDNYVHISDINQTFLNSIVAIEDHRFYEHGAIDLISIIRAITINLKNDEIVEGGSTITQQLAKNLFLNTQQTLSRKVSEIFIAFELERLYTKEEILELYVNIIYYGDGHTGIKEACNGYFNKEPNEINTNEATLLAGLPQAPNLYALSNHYNNALERQKEVIEALNKWNIQH